MYVRTENKQIWYRFSRYEYIHSIWIIFKMTILNVYTFPGLKVIIWTIATRQCDSWQYLYIQTSRVSLMAAPSSFKVIWFLLKILEYNVNDYQNYCSGFSILVTSIIPFKAHYTILSGGNNSWLSCPTSLLHIGQIARLTNQRQMHLSWKVCPQYNIRTLTFSVLDSFTSSLSDKLAWHITQSFGINWFLFRVRLADCKPLRQYREYWKCDMMPLVFQLFQLCFESYMSSVKCWVFLSHIRCFVSQCPVFKTFGGGLMDTHCLYFTISVGSIDWHWCLTLSSASSCATMYNGFAGNMRSISASERLGTFETVSLLSWLIRGCCRCCCCLLSTKCAITSGALAKASASGFIAPSILFWAIIGSSMSWFTRGSCGGGTLFWFRPRNKCSYRNRYTNCRENNTNWNSDTRHV